MTTAKSRAIKQLREMYNDTEILSCGSIGPALSSGGYTIYFVLADGQIICFRGCFTGTIDELDTASKERHTGAGRDWYESAINHIRLSANQVLDKHGVAA